MLDYAAQYEMWTNMIHDDLHFEDQTDRVDAPDKHPSDDWDLQDFFEAKYGDRHD